jgi:hypothetical protein
VHSQSSNTFTISDISQSLAVAPAAIAEVTFKVDLRFVLGGLDDGDLGIVGNNETRNATDRRKGAGVGAETSIYVCWQ